MSQCLVIIDMQYCFPAATDKHLINNILDQISYAKQRNMMILVVTYAALDDSEGGRTNSRLIDDLEVELFGYHNILYIEKDNDDGSPDIVKQLRKHEKQWPSSFLVTGVNTDQCVKATVEGLDFLARHYGQEVKLEVLWDCCMTDAYRQPDPNHIFRSANTVVRNAPFFPVWEEDEEEVFSR